MIVITFDGHRKKQEEGLLRLLEAALQGFTGYELVRSGPGPLTKDKEARIAKNAKAASAKEARRDAPAKARKGKSAAGANARRA